MSAKSAGVSKNNSLSMNGAAWNFVMWGFLHGLLLLIHRMIKGRGGIKNLKENFPKAYLFASTIITQWAIFLTWIIFRVEDTEILTRSIKSYLLLDCNYNLEVALNSIPRNNLFTAFLAFIFIFGHLSSSNKEITLKYKISNYGDVSWGVVVGCMIVSIWLFKPEDIVSFIYFRF